MNIQIKQYCHITSSRVFLRGKRLFKSAYQYPEMNDFLSEIYTFLGIDYRKFFKMDALSKAGFLASEILLQSFDREQTKEDMGILLFNQSGSIEADRAYQETIQDKDNYFPSPAVFVYTLPNIVAGEIAIRNKIHGETSFFVLPQLQYTTIEDTVKGVFCNSDLKYLLTGWVEVEDDELDVRMMLCAPGDGGRINIKAATIEKIYKK